VLLTAHSGDLNGFVMLKDGDEKLAEIRREDTFLDFTIGGAYCLEGFGTVPGYVGDGLADVFGRWSKPISS